jgi:hypothetical protein
MALTLEQLKRFFDAQGIGSYFEAPDRPAILAGFQGANGSYQVLVHLELEGTFLQFRTINWLRCPSDHPALGELLKAIADINYRRRLVKIGWDPVQGELAAYADVWIEDGTLTQQQFTRMLSVYLPVMDLAYGRLTTTMETGRDPGDPSLEDVVAAATGGADAGGGAGGGADGTVPDKVRRLLDELRKKGAPPEEPATPTTVPDEPWI